MRTNLTGKENNFFELREEEKDIQRFNYNDCLYKKLELAKKKPKRKITFTAFN